MADLVKVTELRRSLSIDPSKDTEFLRALSQIYTYLETRTNRLWLYREDYEQQFQPEGRSGSLRLKLTPVDEITTVQEWLGTEQFADATTVPTTEYQVNLESGRLTRWGTTCGYTWKDFVKVTYSGGYTSDTCPLDVQHAIEIQLKYMLERWQMSNVSVRNKTIAKNSSQFITDTLHPVFRDACVYYRKRYA